MKNIRNSALSLIQQMLILDTYQKSYFRQDELGMDQNPQGREVPLESAVHTLFPELFEDDPNNHAQPEMLRSGEIPLELHLESGSGASSLTIPGILTSLLKGRDGKIQFNVPDVTSSSIFMDLIMGGPLTVFFNDVNIRPAANEGSINLFWQLATNSLKIDITFETEGDPEISGDMEYDFDRIKLQIFLHPRLSRGRLLWDWAARSRARTDGVSRTKIVASNPDLIPLIVMAESNLVIAGGGSLLQDIGLWFSGDDEAAQGLADALSGFAASALGDLVELIGNGLLALPLRPVAIPQNSTVNSDFFRDLGSNLTNHPDPNISGFGNLIHALSQSNPLPNQLLLDPDQLLLFQLLSGERNDQLFVSALGAQNLATIFPSHSLEQLVSSFQTIFEQIAHDWRDAAIANNNPNFAFNLEILTHLLGSATTRKFKSEMFSQLEFAHIVNRQVKYNLAEFRLNLNQARLQLEWEDLDLPQGKTDVPCMRYLVSLDKIVFDGRLRGFLLEDSSRSQQDINLFGRRIMQHNVRIEWEVYTFHEAFGDPLDTVDWDQDAQGLFPGANLLLKNTVSIPLKSLIMGLDGKLSKNLFLEWNTNDNALNPNCKLLITGKVRLENLELGRFAFPIGMHSEMGLLNAGSAVLPNAEVDNICSFKAPFSQGNPAKQLLSGHIFASLTQLPFAGAFETIEVSAINFVLTPFAQLPQRSKPFISFTTPFILEGKLNGVTFQTTTVQFGSNSNRLNNPQRGITQTLGTGWSKTIVYPKSSIAATFEIEFVAHLLDPNNLGTITRSISAIQQVHRFTDAAQQQIQATETSLIDAIQDAVDHGAVREWDIPIGLPFIEKVMHSNPPEFDVKIRITKKNFDASSVPAAEAPKKMRVQFLEAEVGENGDFSDGEVKFFPKIVLQNEEAGLESTYDLGETRKFDVEDNETVRFPGPPTQDLMTKPLKSTIISSCRCKELDNPTWFDPHDSLGTASISTAVPVDNGIDGMHSDHSNGPDGDFTLNIQIDTISPPPKPRLHFDGYPDGYDYLANPAGANLLLAFEISWTDLLILQFKDASTNDQFINSNTLVQGLSGVVGVNPQISTTYRLAAFNQVNINGEPSLSGELIVDIN